MAGRQTRSGGAAAKTRRKKLKDDFKKRDAGALGPQEMLELILGYAEPCGRAGAAARALMHRFKGLRGVLDASPDELKKAGGVGESSALLLKLFKDIGAAYLRERIMGTDIIACPKDALDYLHLSLSGERVEKFLAIYLNGKNEVLAIETLHEGTINQTMVYPRKVIERAFKHNARGVIFVHNHPSGDASPSEVDRMLTKSLDRASLAVDLIVHDHIIIGRDNHFSAREQGWIIGVPAHPQHA